MTSSPIPRTKVFVSYSHRDVQFLERLQIHLQPDVREGNIDAWDDTRIQPGALWRGEINQALKITGVAVLLVSADFLASDFIARNELPSLLDAAKSEGVTVLPVLLKPCRYKPKLGEIQFINKPMISLIEMSEAQQEITWMRVAEEIARTTGTPTSSVSSLSASIQQSLNAQPQSTQQLQAYLNKTGGLLNDDQLNFVLGRVASGNGDYDTAIARFKTCHFEDPVDEAKVKKELGLAYRRRGEAHRQETDYDKAIQYLKEAIDLNPDDSDTLAILGGFYRRKHDYVRALDFYSRAWRVDIRSAYALGNLASLSWYLGMQSDARIFFGFAEVVATERIRQGLSEDYWDYYDRALAQLVTGKLAEAKNTYANAIKRTPGDVQLDAVLSNLYLLQRAPQLLTGLDEIIRMIEDAKAN